MLVYVTCNSASAECCKTSRHQLWLCTPPPCKPRVYVQTVYVLPLLLLAATSTRAACSAPIVDGQPLGDLLVSRGGGSGKWYSNNRTGRCPSFCDSNTAVLAAGRRDPRTEAKVCEACCIILNTVSGLRPPFGGPTRCYTYCGTTTLGGAAALSH